MIQHTDSDLNILPLTLFNIFFKIGGIKGQNRMSLMTQ